MATTTVDSAEIGRRSSRRRHATPTRSRNRNPRTVGHMDDERAPRALTSTTVPDLSPGTVMSFLVTSIVASIVLTIVANIALRSFTRKPRHMNQHETGPRREKSVPWSDTRTRNTTRVFFPWKLMLAVSVIATLIVNVIR